MIKRYYPQPDSNFRHRAACDLVGYKRKKGGGSFARKATMKNERGRRGERSRSGIRGAGERRMR